jgi:type I restriction enzyme S subunit
MNKDKKMIPELRFPEFLNDEEWAEKLIGDITISESSSMALNKLELKPKGYPVYGADSIVGYIDDFQQEEKYISIVKDGSGVGRLNLCQSRSSILGTLVCLKSKNKKLYYLDWIYYLLNTVDFSVYVKGAGIPHIYFSDFKFEKISVPKPKEQQKIASCLSSLDEVIAAHSQKLELLKDHKKGLMQNLFPQEGEKVPKFRFKEFEKDGEWVEKSLEYLTIKIGDGIHTTPKYDPSGEYYFINGNNLIEGKIVVDEKTKRVSSEEFEMHKKDLTEKTIFLSINGTIGNLAFYNNEKVVLGKSACFITPSQKLNNVFLFYSLQSPKIIDYFFSELTGSTIKNLSLKSIRETLFNLPSEKEQQKIAYCLSSLDALITSQTEKIEQLKLHKNGLMQSLFPKIID